MSLPELPRGSEMVYLVGGRGGERRRTRARLHPLPLADGLVKQLRLRRTADAVGQAPVLRHVAARPGGAYATQPEKESAKNEPKKREQQGQQHEHDAAGNEHKTRECGNTQERVFQGRRDIERKYTHWS